MDDTITLGKKYRDSVTDFEGIATSKYEYLNGCLRVELTAKVEEEGKKPLCLVFDHEQLELVDDGIIEKVRAAIAARYERKAPTGGGGMGDLAPATGMES